ncbi:MAG: transcriptional repressor [Rhodobiaceae bacterium]|jgi:Fur family transcriptional regulator, ferric uptake regulator|nr:transcriptional repressor [Rhodobiaceae bacterium]MBT5641038.1 transcriptional repressor [Rhodobiaceae bacterium]MBT6223634.1 transcriptional repressor [Rhodobiaceae bacterium]
MMVEKNTIEFRCVQQGMRMTEQRKIIAKVLSSSKDHPDVEELYKRSARIDKNISLATVYRTVKLFEDAGILEKHEFKDGRSRYEKTPDGHHDHLIDINTGDVIEFQSEEIEKLQKKIAQQLGFDIIDHRLEIYAVKTKNNK